MEIFSWILKVLTLPTRVQSVNVTGWRCPMDHTVKRSVAISMVLSVIIMVFMIGHLGVTISVAASPAPSSAVDQPWQSGCTRIMREPELGSEQSGGTPPPFSGWGTTPWWTAATGPLGIQCQVSFSVTASECCWVFGTALDQKRSSLDEHWKTFIIFSDDPWSLLVSFC